MLDKTQSLLLFINEHKALAFIKNKSNHIGSLPKYLIFEWITNWSVWPEGKNQNNRTLFLTLTIAIPAATAAAPSTQAVREAACSCCKANPWASEEWNRGSTKEHQPQGKSLSSKAMESRLGQKSIGCKDLGKSQGLRVGYIPRLKPPATSNHRGNAGKG